LSHTRSILLGQIDYRAHTGHPATNISHRSG
jgi:hypothetical protein